MARKPVSSTYPPHARLIVDVLPESPEGWCVVVMRQQTGFTRLEDLRRYEVPLEDPQGQLSRMQGHLIAWLLAALAALRATGVLRDAVAEQLGAAFDPETD